MDMLIQDQIVECIEQEHLFEASTLLEKYLRLEGKDEFYYLAGSDIRLGYEDYQGVCTLLEEAMETGLTGPLIWERISEAEIGLENYDQAGFWLEKVLESQDLGQEDEPRILFDLGRCAIAQGNYEQAVKHFEDILLEEDNEETRFLLGMSYGELQMYERMDDAFLGLLDKPEYRDRILEYMMYQDSPEILLDYLDQADFTEFDRLLAFSQYWLNHNSPLDAAEVMEEAWTLEHDPEVLASAVVLYGQAGDIRHGRRLFHVLMDVEKPETDPGHFTALQLEALEEMQYTDRTCRKYLEAILRKGGDDPDSTMQCAQFCLNHDMADVAYKILSRNPENMPLTRSLEWCRLLSLACLQIEHYQEAYHCLKAHQGLKDRMYRKNLAIASYCTGRSREALHESLAILPDGIGAIIAFLVYDERGEQDKATEVIRQMQKALAKKEPIEDISNFIGFLEEIAEKTAA